MVDPSVTSSSAKDLMPGWIRCNTRPAIRAMDQWMYSQSLTRIECDVESTVSDTYGPQR